jgi:exodeoxyribonuclease VII small subunit
MNVDDSIDALEKTVSKLEQDQPDFDTALSLYETGINLANSCLKNIAKAEQKVTRLMKEHEELREIELDNAS